jgi:hypothetical protein
MLQTLFFLISMFLLISCANRTSGDQEIAENQDKKSITDSIKNEPAVLNSEEELFTKTQLPLQMNKKTDKKNKPEVKKEVLQNQNELPKPKTEDVESEKNEIKKPSVEITKAPAEEPLNLHRDWNRLLKIYVSTDGKVNYFGLKKEKQSIEKYLKLLSENSPASNWTRQESMAFWINLYNAFTIDLILEKYPINSIMELEKGNVWKSKSIRIGGISFTLDKIEKEILLGAFKDPRVHFAVVCAASSCPPLLNEAWTKENIDNKLEEQTLKFINNSLFNSLSSKSIEISKIFEWYSNDFGNVINFLNKYAKISIDSKAKIKYKAYDWGLNKQ